MIIPNYDTKSANLPVTSRPLKYLKDFSILLEEYGVQCIRSEYYWVVGSITEVQGWVLHLSVIKSKLFELLTLIVPELIRYNVPFKIVKDYYTAVNLLEGNLGYICLGKLICIYPKTDHHASQLAQKLIELTKFFAGPDIPTDFHLGSVVYTRYGSVKPVIIKSKDGVAVKHIYNSKGNLIPDPYSIPFSLQSGIRWPFQVIAEYPRKKRPLLLNRKYYPVNILKPDPKGNVLRAVYFQSLWQIKSCIIKEARNAMSTDEMGRDIKDKLKWQFQLYKNLSSAIPMPRMFDYFEEENNAYLVMEIVRGNTLWERIESIYKGKSWIDLSTYDKVQITDYLIRIINIIQKFHQLGYIHRDITTENFLIDKKGKIFLIDMELTWCIQSLQPDPPFGLGTHGFMSPQQIDSKTPTIKEDIYALGCCMLFSFTNLLPNKWNIHDRSGLREKLPEFIGNKAISDLICNCLQYSPEDRPELSFTVNSLRQYQHELKNKSNGISQEQPNSFVEDLSSMIQAGIRGLSDSKLLSPKGCWISKTPSKSTEMLKEQVGMEVVPGWHTGIAGPMWFIARAKNAAFDVSSCKNTYENNFEHLLHYYGEHIHDMNPGLFHGSAGIALAIGEGLNNELINFDERIRQILGHCFSSPAQSLELAAGVAGQGISLLRCLPWIETKTGLRLLSTYTTRIIKEQNLKYDNVAAAGIDLYSGDTGIIWFLLAYVQAFPDPHAKAALQKALTWITSKAFNKQQIYRPYTSSGRSIASLPGIMLCLIKAYSLLNEESYKQLVETNLYSLPLRPVSSNFTLQAGLAGLGHAFIEASLLFKNHEWQRRAIWIAKLFELTFQDFGQDRGYWIVDQSNLITADLFEGITGVSNFLLTCHSPAKFSHPLWPY
jgi:serine/threonine protein kinase